MSAELLAPAVLSLGRDPRYPLDIRLGGSQRWSGRRGKEKIIDPIGTRTPTLRQASLLYPLLEKSNIDLLINSKHSGFYLELAAWVMK